MPECEVLQKARYINTLTFTFIFTFTSYTKFRALGYSGTLFDGFERDWSGLNGETRRLLIPIIALQYLGIHREMRLKLVPRQSRRFSDLFANSVQTNERGRLQFYSFSIAKTVVFLVANFILEFLLQYLRNGEKYGPSYTIIV